MEDGLPELPEGITEVRCAGCRLVLRGEDTAEVNRVAELHWDNVQHVRAVSQIAVDCNKCAFQVSGLSVSEVMALSDAHMARAHS